MNLFQHVHTKVLYFLKFEKNITFIAVLQYVLICSIDFKMERPIVTLTEGQIQGTTLKSVLGQHYLAFRGIPFAQPPLGDLRFRVYLIQKISSSL